MKFTFPDPFQFDGFPEYLKALPEANSHRFSYRALALTLNWPSSLISDVLAGRKRLSLRRVLELSELAGFSSIYTERLIAITCIESIPPEFREKLELPETPKAPESKSLESPLPFFDILIVFEIIKASAGNPLSCEQISQMIVTKDVSPEKVAMAMDLLQREKLIASIGPDAYEVLVEDIDTDLPANGLTLAKSLERQKDFAYSFIGFCENPGRPASYNSGIVEICESDIHEIHDRFGSLRNKLRALAKKKGPGPRQIFQLDLNFFPLTKKAENPQT